MDRSDAVAFDARLRQALRTERATLTVAAAGLLVVTGVLLAIGANALAIAGLLFVTAFVALMASDSWHRRARPPLRTSAVRGSAATVLTASRLPLVGAAVAAGGLVLLMASVVLGDGLADTADGRRGGFVLYLAVPLVPILLAAAVVLAVRPSYLAATTEGIEVRAHGRTRFVSWTSVDTIGPLQPAAGGQLGGGLTLLVSGGGQRQPLATRQLSATLWVLTAWLQHYLDVPKDRAELGTAAASQRLEAIQSDLADPALEPRWFPPPTASRARGSEDIIRNGLEEQNRASAP